MSNAQDLIKFPENGFAMLAKSLGKEGWPTPAEIKVGLPYLVMCLIMLAS